MIGNHLLADHLPLAFYPLAWARGGCRRSRCSSVCSRLPWPSGVVPLWRIARRLANLRVGATAALIVAYAAHPAVNAVNLADFHLASVAVAPLLAAVHAALAGSWRRYAVFAALAVACDADLGLVVAGLGMLLVLEGRSRVGLLSVGSVVGWTALAVLVLQPRWGTAGLVGPGAFAGYGDLPSTCSSPWCRTRSGCSATSWPRPNARAVVMLFAPLLFLPVLAPRLLLAAVPLQALYFVADVPMTGAARRPSQRAVARVRFRRGGDGARPAGSAQRRAGPGRPAGPRRPGRRRAGLLAGRRGQLAVPHPVAVGEPGRAGRRPPGRRRGWSTTTSR